jgi:hypothetical protein
LLALALTGFLAGLAAVFFRLRGEFSRSTAFITVALLAGATPLAYLTFFEPNALELSVFAAVAWLAFFANLSAGARSKALPVGLWLLIATLLLYQWPLQLWPSRWVDVLFSSWHGFLSWTPVVYAAVIGTAAYARRNRTWAFASLAILLAAAWAAGARSDWSTAPGFSARRMAPLLAILAPGLAYLLDVTRRRPAIAIAPLVLAPLVWNHLLMLQYTVGLLPKDEPVSFARLVRQQADAYARSANFYPFAFPASVWFAWHERVPVDRYDLLALEPRRSAVDLLFDRRVTRFLLDGWDAPATEASAPAWWLRGREAALALPLSLPQDQPVEITVKARSRFEEPVVHGDLALVVNGQTIGEFSPAAASASEARFIVPAEQRLWREGINRIAFVSRGTHRVDPSDQRSPGPLARRGGNPAWPVAIYRLTIRPMG